MQNQQKWYQQPVTVVLFLIFFFPVGLYLMWKYDLWSKTSRIIVSVFFGLLVLGNLNNKNSSNSANKNNGATIIEKIKHTFNLSKDSEIEDKLCGNYYAGDMEEINYEDYITLNKDYTWKWFGYNENKKEVVAYGKFSINYFGKWAFGPDCWEINFIVEGGYLAPYFDENQMIYYHDHNTATGFKNYFRLNGMMPETGASTDFYKKGK